MRAYFIPVSAGLLLSLSAFLPWMKLGDASIGGIPDMAGWWILVLGVIAVLLASLSIWTRKNSRHPLLLVGLISFAILFLGYQWMSRSIRNSAWAQSQARSIVEEVPAVTPPDAVIGPGIYLGVAGAVVLVLFGLTIVVKRVPRAYAVSEDDDI